MIVIWLIFSISDLLTTAQNNLIWPCISFNYCCTFIGPPIDDLWCVKLRGSFNQPSCLLISLKVRVSELRFIFPILPFIQIILYFNPFLINLLEMELFNILEYADGSWAKSGVSAYIFTFVHLSMLTRTQFSRASHFLLPVAFVWSAKWWLAVSFPTPLAPESERSLPEWDGEPVYLWSGGQECAFQVVPMRVF